MVETLHKVFVPVQWVKEIIETGPIPHNYVVVECSWGKPSEEYLEKHIPGAIHLDTDLIEEDINWNIRTPEEINDTLISLGISKSTHVFIYGKGASFARFAFVCIWAGVQNVHVINGGLNAWISAGYPTEQGIVEPKPISEFGSEIPEHPEYLISWPTEILEAQKNPNFRLVSVRSWREFIGEVSGYSYINRSGEPKGAIWGHDEAEYYNDDRTVKSLTEVEAMLSEWDIRKGNEIAFYCGTGWRASLPFLILYENGWDNIKVYDGGWFVWQKDPELPVQIGSPREKKS